ncbi:MAG: cyclic nucleotide-binding domain-containing protein [Spirochaetia bacterium]|nr:cyclic nucleotide-binding domain-containing protein [Spirochaetia bacterium]
MISADQLKQYSYFNHLNQNCLEEAVKRLETVCLPSGSEIIKQNSPADFLYFVKKGEVEITKRTRHGQDAKITSLHSGESFGEMALLTCSPRNNSVRALTDVTLLRLKRSDFDDIVMMDSSLKNMIESKICEYKNYNDLKTLQPLALVPPEKMTALMEKFTEKFFNKGDVILKEGETGDFYYIIKEGQCSVTRENQKIDTISTGDGFGEEAIIRDHKRNATITALTDTVLLALDKNDFNALLKKSFLDFTFPEEISEEEMAKYVFIDARIPPEFEEEHIAGALNIPLEILRSKFHELDPNTEYLTYCTNDSRGMAAAFLMASQGFKARNLRSGLSGWEGPLLNNREGIHYPDRGGMSPEEEDAMLEKLLNKK